MLYDINKSFAHHWQHGFDFEQVPGLPVIPPVQQAIKIFDRTVSSRIGIPACPLTTAQGIKQLAHMGYSIFTYKTIRSKAVPAHPVPNICYVLIEHSLLFDKTDHSFHGTPVRPTSGFALANSFGNACPNPEEVQIDIAAARNALSDQQLLIVSVYGSGETEQEICDDYADTAALAQEAGAQAIECNLSCPNVPGVPPFYTHPETVFNIIKKVTDRVQLPVSIKIGLCNPALLKQILLAAARAGAQGICGINTIPTNIIDRNGKPYFGAEQNRQRFIRRSCRSIALQTIEEAGRIIRDEKLSLTLFAAGGITQPEHIDQFLAAGADVAMSATGVMLNPHLAMHYLRNLS